MHLILLWNSRIEQLNGALKASELHHGVGNLSHPQGHETLVESRHTLILVHKGKGLTQGADEARGGLDLDLCNTKISFFGLFSQFLIFTLAASMGLRAMSAKNSALAEEARYSHVLYW